MNIGSGRLAQLVRVLSQYAKVAGSILGQGTYKKQPMNAQISGTTNWCFSLSKINKLKKLFESFFFKVLFI